MKDIVLQRFTVVHILILVQKKPSICFQDFYMCVFSGFWVWTVQHFDEVIVLYFSSFFFNIVFFSVFYKSDCAAFRNHRPVIWQQTNSWLTLCLLCTVIFKVIWRSLNEDHHLWCQRGQSYPGEGGGGSILFFLRVWGKQRDWRPVIKALCQTPISRAAGEDVCRVACCREGLLVRPTSKETSGRPRTQRRTIYLCLDCLRLLLIKSRHLRRQ